MDSFRDLDMTGDYGSEGAAAEYLGVAGELRDLISAENELLRQGLPEASLSSSERKRELTEAYSIVSGLHEFGSEVGADARFSWSMRTARAELGLLSAENSNLRAGANHAARKRVDAVIEAALGTGAVPTQRTLAGSR